MPVSLCSSLARITSRLNAALCESPYFQIYGSFMQMSQLVIENIVSVLGGASVVVIGLSSWLGSLWSKRILNQEKLRMDKELQQLKDSNLANLKSMERELQVELQKRDHYHQISKSTYEMNFERKVKVYTELLLLNQKFFRFMNESPLADEPECTETYYGYFEQCKTLIEKEKLYVSSKLAERYELWYQKALPYFKQAGLDGYAVHGFAHTDEENKQNIYDAQEPARYDLVCETFKEMQAIFEQVEIDVASIRRIIELPMQE